MDTDRSLDSPRARVGFHGPQTMPDGELSNTTPQVTAPPLHQRPTRPQRARNPARCRFFGTKKGCRAGDACPYQHVAGESLDQGGLDINQAGKDEPNLQDEGLSSSSTAGAPHSNQPQIRQNQQQPAHRAVRAEPHPAQNRKPVAIPVRNNSREFQLNQIRRRFHPKETNDENGTTLSFGMVPTDPDFPFELAELNCILHVPSQYPSEGSRPSLKVANPEMERGFQINVEQGFDQLVTSTLQRIGSVTLLGLMNSLDRQLETLLTTERAQTIKFVANVGARDGSKDENSITGQKDTGIPGKFATDSNSVPTSSPVKGPVYTSEEKYKAEQTRNDETRQLNARLGRLPLFKKSPDGTYFLIPITPSKPADLPTGLREVKAVKLDVPALYPLEHSYIELQGVERKDARPVEVGFDKWVKPSPHLTLMSQVNYLAQNLHILAQTRVEEDTNTAETLTAKSQIAPPVDEQKSETLAVEDVEDRSHIKVIPRPPEWSQTHQSGTDSDYTSDEYDSYDSEAEDSQASDEGGAIIPEEPTPSNPARGVSLSFPSLELYGIELLELTSLSITIKCDRCKDMMDIKNIKAANVSSNSAPIRTESCKKCANSMTIGYRREFMHHTAHRAGYLDLDGCTVVDLLTSYFVPTCSECSTSFPAPGVVAVRGESAMTNCRECHRRMVFKLPDVKFLVVGPSGLTLKNRPAPRKKVKETLGIVAGQELPRRGRCGHYSKSYRWFRFSCCAKVFPCDRCHDAASDHPNEHANRMICGFCSREQHYRPEDCGFCHSVLVGKAGSGFWEGGKGTRDKVRMSRKDPRKYKRRPGTTPTAGGGAASSSAKKK